MRFLFLTQYYPPEIGAPQTCLRATVAELRAQGHEVEVVTALPNYPTGKIFPGYRRTLYRRETIDGVSVRRSWVYAAMGSGLRRMAGYVSFTATCLPLLLSARRPDVIVAESPPLPLAVPASIAARRFGIPWILTVSDLWPDMAQEAGMLHEGFVLSTAQKLERWAYRDAAAVSTMTEELAAVLREEKKVPAEKVLLLPNGVDTTLFRPQGPTYPLAKLSLEGKRVFLYAGTFGYFQNLPKIIEAAALIEKERDDVAFLLVGDGSVRSDLEARVAALGLRSVHFLPPVSLEDVAALYRSCTAAVVPLATGAWTRYARPSKMVQAMATGKPVLFLGGGAAAELVAKNGAGLVVEREEPKEIAAAVLQLLNDPTATEEMGRKGRELAESTFAWGPLVKRWSASVAELLRKGTSSSRLSFAQQQPQ